MLNAIIGFAIRNKLIIGLFTIALIAYGSYEATRLPIDAVPDITNNQVQVITVAPSFGATDIERLVTFPIEQANTNIAGLTEIRSFSRFGLSLVTLVFDDATDVYWARQQVAERLLRVKADIPDGIGVPELGPVSTGLGEIYQYVVRPAPGFEDRYDATKLRTIQDWIVRRQLLGVRGVAEVSSFGGKLKQYAIAVDPHKLMGYGLSIGDVFKALEANNQNTGGAYIEKGPTVLYIRTEGLAANPADLENTIIRRSNGASLFVRDIATVQESFATRYGAMCYNNQGEVAGAVVMMLKGANSSEVIKNVKQRIEQIRKTLPEGVLIEPFLDRTKMVNNAIGTVEKNLLEGALIVVFVLVLFLGNFRAGLLVASVIPLAMLFAVIMMNLFGVSGNLMSLGALDFGLIVDGAVIIVEAVMHRLGHSKHFKDITHLSRPEMDKEVGFAAGKMMNSAVFGQIIILVVYLPIFTLQGIEGKMFKPMAQTVAFALLGAFILSLTYIPMMSAWVLSRKIKHQPNLSDRVMEKVERVFQHTLSKLLGYPKIVLATVSVVFVLALLVLSRMGGEFIPALEEGDFAVDTRVLTGSNLSTTIANTQKAASLLLERFPEVEKVVTKIGSGEVPTDPMPMDASDMMVILRPKDEWKSAKTFDQLSEKMGATIAEIPGVTAGFQFPVQMRFNELMTGARQDVVCKIFGEDLDTLAAYAAKLGTIINTIEGAKNLYVEPVSGMPQIVIRYHRDQLARFDVSIAEVNRLVNMAFAGQRAGVLYEGEKRFDVVVRLQGDLKKNAEDIRQLLIPAAGNIQLPLYQLADVAIKEGPNQVQREDAKRRIITGFNVRRRDVQSIVMELQQKASVQLHLPAGYYITYGGAFENLEAAKKRLMIAVPVSLLLIFLLLYFAFTSVRQGLLIYSAIPLSAIGGILFLALRGMPFSISAGVGFIALFGVAVLNGIVLVAEFNRLRGDGLHDMRRVVLMGTKVRLRPVLMTAFVASLGFLPMAISNGAGAEVQRPLATVVIGGLLIATFLTLFVLPVLYTVFEGSKGKQTKMPAAPAAIILLLALMGASQQSQAQQKLGLQQSIDTALHNNLLLKNDQTRAAIRERLARTGANLPKTSLTAEGGQINSLYTDTRIGLSQGFALPAVYQRQKLLLLEEWKSGLLNVAYGEAQLKKQVRSVFYQFAYLNRKKELLQYADSIYTMLADRAAQRLAKGESNLLEKASAEMQRDQVRAQQAIWKEDSVLLQLQFQWLLGSAEPVLPMADTNLCPLPLLTDTSALREHTSMKLLQQDKSIAAAGLSLEKSRLLPEFSIGYFNSSIRGMGADNKVYDAGKRFQSAQLGIALPIFARAQKEKISSARLGTKLASDVYEAGLKNLQIEYGAALAALNKYASAMRWLEKQALPNASLVAATASRQLTLGSINYLEWVQLMNQVMTVRNEYIEAMKNYNESVVGIYYLLNQ